MGKKKIQLGVLLLNKVKFDGVEKTLASIALGNDKNSDSKYNTSVEIIVRDGSGKIIHEQKNGYISLADPRMEPDRLLELGMIDENEYEKRKASTSKISEKLRYCLEIYK